MVTLVIWCSVSGIVAATQQLFNVPAFVVGGWACDAFIRNGSMGLSLSTVRRICVVAGCLIQAITCMLLALGVSPTVIALALITKNIVSGFFDAGAGPVVMEMSAKYAAVSSHTRGPAFFNRWPSSAGILPWRYPLKRCVLPLLCWTGNHGCDKLRQ